MADSVFLTVDGTKGIQAKTAEEYKRRLRRLMEWIGADGDSWHNLKDFDKVMSTLKDLGTTTQQCYLSVIAVVLRSSGSEAGEALAKYREVISRNNHIIQENYDQQRPVEGDISWQELLEARERLRERASFNRRDNMKHLALCLYTMHPPARNNYSKMRVMDTKDLPEEALVWEGNHDGFCDMITQKQTSRDDINYCVRRVNGSMYFVFRNHKTRKDSNGDFHTLFVECKQDLGEVVKDSLDMYPRRWLLEQLNVEGQPYQATSIGTMLKTEFPFRKPPGAGMFRRAYLSNALKDMPAYKKRAKDAAMMMHSVETGERKYRKII